MPAAAPNPRRDGRGAMFNPKNRFERLECVRLADDDIDEADRPAARTVFLRDDSQTILSWNDSPDVGFNAGLNPYRGCEHGCAYCFARPTHEYLGFNSALDFESKILIKPKAAEILRSEMMKPT